jgi:hypothetical protein
MGKDEKIRHLDWELDPVMEANTISELATRRVYVDAESWFARHKKFLAGLTAASVLLGGGFILGRSTSKSDGSAKTLEESEGLTNEFQPLGPTGPIGISRP